MHVNPLRSSWPLDDDGTEDAIMQTFVLYASLRYLTWATVSTAVSHVIEWHRMAGISPPVFGGTVYVLKKLNKTMAIENPKGRAIRTGVTVEEVHKIFTVAHDMLAKETDPEQRKDLANIIMAMSAIYEKAIRKGNVLPAPATWSKLKNWSRHTI
jgi:hypothetical protein